MTAVLPLTEDEERETREIWDDGSPGSLVARLLATLDAERAKRAAPVAIEAGAVPPGKTCGDCVHAPRCVSIFGTKVTDTECQFNPQRFRASASVAPPHSRSEAKRLAAQRGEPAPVFDLRTEPVVNGCIAEADAIEAMVRGALAALPAELLEAARRLRTGSLVETVGRLASALRRAERVVEAARTVCCLRDAGILHPMAGLDEPLRAHDHPDAPKED